MRKKGSGSRRAQASSRNSNTLSGISSLGADLDSAIRPRANSSDIAEERGVSLYPLVKKSEGKILRPQYKDILKGKASTWKCKL